MSRMKTYATTLDNMSNASLDARVKRLEQIAILSLMRDPQLIDLIDELLDEEQFQEEDE